MRQLFLGLSLLAGLATLAARQIAGSDDNCQCPVACPETRVAGIKFADLTVPIDGDAEFGPNNLPESVARLLGSRVRIRGFANAIDNSQQMRRFVLRGDYFLRDDILHRDQLLVRLAGQERFPYTLRPIVVEGVLGIETIQTTDGRKFSVFKLGEAQASPVRAADSGD